MNEKESAAVNTIKDNPKFFYSYAKSFAKTKSKVAPLQEPGGSLVDSPKGKADILQGQYVSVFSNPECADMDKCMSYLGDKPPVSLCDVTFSEEDIIDAITELSPYSACPDDDIPAKILCECKAPLSTPLLLLWRSSLDQGVVPSCLKQQSITPIFKKGDRTAPANYRPVSLTSHVIKIFERVIRKQLVEYLENNSIIDDNQHGFRKQRSCVTQLLEHIDYILKTLAEGEEVDVIYLDFSKAFDKVSHNVLLEKLKHYGIDGKLYKWIESFLTNRKQKVVIDGVQSDDANVESGVPQGTVLGPVFFIIYIIDLIVTLKSSKALKFADDTKLISKIIELACQALLQTDLNSVMEWTLANNMKLNEDKFEVMNFCLNSTKLLRSMPFSIESLQYVATNGQTIDNTEIVKDLGIYISNDCSWTHHINTTASSARKMASWILGAFRDRSALTMMTLFKSLVRSKLEYCCLVWSPTKITEIQTLENVQREFTRRIIGMKDCSYWERLKKLKLISLQRRRERYIIIHTWKIMKNMVPNGVSLKFTTNERLGNKIKLPMFSHKAQRSVSSAYESFYTIKAASLWNILPKSVNSAESLDVLKSELGRFMEQYPDMPPVTGYTPPNSNSLIDWRNSGGHGVCA